MIIALQFHSGDKPQAMRLAKFMADIEPEYRGDVELCFVAAPGLHEIDTALHCAKKFQTSQFISLSPDTGWPAGPNAMVKEVLHWMLKRYRKPDFRSEVPLLLLEPDTVPFRKDWLNVLLKLWKEQFALDRWIVGAWRDSGCAGGHINGNCLIRPDIARWINLSIIGKELAWDVAIAPLVHNNWFATDLIVNHFQSTNATDAALRLPNGCMPALVHGYKDDSAYEIARRLMPEGVK